MGLAGGHTSPGASCFPPFVLRQAQDERCVERPRHFPTGPKSGLPCGMLPILSRHYFRTFAAPHSTVRERLHFTHSKSSSDSVRALRKLIRKSEYNIYKTVGCFGRSASSKPACGSSGRAMRQTIKRRICVSIKVTGPPHVEPARRAASLVETPQAAPTKGRERIVSGNFALDIPKLDGNLIKNYNL